MTNDQQTNPSAGDRATEQTIFKEETIVKKPTALGLEENIAGLLSYLFPPIIAIVLLFMEKENKFVRFHAIQSIILTVTIIVLAIGLTIFGVILSAIKLGFIGGIISFGFWILAGPLFFFTAVFLIYQAYQGKMFKLPVIGNIAEKHAGPKSVEI
ncbi:DUF4870 domain-containing protein [Sporosarcina siberiensis]|uniref:DUF4870 domain-containing protein n=1 Tax=Sporosarcina siberiensis TaxID=1365606 RepID=A0ABW4SDU4_9BACL